MKTASEFLADLRRDNPTRRFAASRSGAAIGVWEDSMSRFRILAGLLLGCQCMAPYNGGKCQCRTQGWAAMPELLIDGKPLVAESDWVE